MRKNIQNLKIWINRNNKYLMPLSLILGFVVDSLTLKHLDRAFENIVFIVYLFLAILGIFIFNYLRERSNRNSFEEKIYIFCPFLIQFMFGGLFSGFAVFYLRSGSLASSWFFILIILVLMLGNEIFKKRYENFIFQITIFFTGLFFYLIFAVPVFMKVISTSIFLLSGLLALALIFIILYLFYFLLNRQIRKNLKYLISSIVSVFLFVNILYFTNIIPPIPLSLKVGDVYHNVYKSTDGYHVYDEIQKGFLNFTNTIHIKEGEPVYAYSRVFAPTKINTEIVHNWQYFNSETKKWVTESRISFPISGGNLQGYRGYSYKTNLKQGKWRVSVETSRGQVVGRILFKILYTDIAPALEEKTL